MCLLNTYKKKSIAAQKYFSGAHMEYSVQDLTKQI